MDNYELYKSQVKKFIRKDAILSKEQFVLRMNFSTQINQLTKGLESFGMRDLNHIPIAMTMLFNEERHNYLTLFYNINENIIDTMVTSATYNSRDGEYKSGLIKTSDINIIFHDCDHNEKFGKILANILADSRVRFSFQIFTDDTAIHEKIFNIIQHQNWSYRSIGIFITVHKCHILQKIRNIGYIAISNIILDELV